MFQSCHGCNGDIDVGEVAVYAPKVHEDLCWHPACFVCAQCEEQLVDLTYCHKDGAVYCERHYAELVKPRCAACDEVSTPRYCDVIVMSLRRARQAALRRLRRGQYTTSLPCHHDDVTVVHAIVT